MLRLRNWFVSSTERVRTRKRGNGLSSSGGRNAVKRCGGTWDIDGTASGERRTGLGVNLPGAELFMHEDWMGFDLVVPAPGDSTQPVSEPEDSPPSPEPGFSLLRTSFAATIGSASERDLAGAGRSADGRVAECDPGLMGWRRVGCPTEAESGAVGSQRLRPP